VSQALLAAVLDLTDFKRDLSELTDRLGHAQDCL
jgi:peptide chain release factor 2